VQTMFDRIARRYDRTNLAISFGLSELARRRFAAHVLATLPSMDAARPTRILDVACGTGAIASTLARKSPAVELVGVDFSTGMLEVARRKHAQQRNVHVLAGDAMRLPFADASFDAVTCVYGLRNMADPHVALAECARVMRPMGRLWIMDFAMPTHAIAGTLFRLYFLHVLPTLAGLISGDRTGAYAYLPKSVADWKPPQ